MEDYHIDVADVAGNKQTAYHYYFHLKCYAELYNDLETGQAMIKITKLDACVSFPYYVLQQIARIEAEHAFTQSGVYHDLRVWFPEHYAFTSRERTTESNWTQLWIVKLGPGNVRVCLSRSEFCRIKQLLPYMESITNNPCKHCHPPLLQPMDELVEKFVHYKL